MSKARVDDPSELLAVGERLEEKSSKSKCTII
jgi:hypothetical protein